MEIYGIIKGKVAMAWNKYLTYKQGDESTRDLHVLNVYNDPEFNDDVLKATHGNPSNILAGTKYDPDYDESAPSLHDVAKKYHLTLEETMHFSFGRGLMPLPKDPPFSINWDEYDNYSEPFTIKFTNDIKKEDYLALWEAIKRRQAAARHPDDKKSRNRTPENDKLIYAIFKARLKNKKFSQIFRAYQTNTLDGYSGGNQQFAAEESLERYYGKYKPPEVPISPLL